MNEKKEIKEKCEECWEEIDEQFIDEQGRCLCEDCYELEE